MKNVLDFFMKQFIVFILMLFPLIAFTQITVDTSFEGANARVLSVDNTNNVIKVESVLKRGDTRNVVFFFRVSGIDSTRTFKIRVQFSQSYYPPVYAVYSYDRITWYRILGTISGNYKEYSGIFNRRTIYFSHGYPYVYSDLIALQNRLAASPFVNVSNVSYSESGRAVKLFRITNPSVSDSGKSLVWVLGRNHVMESNSNYVVEGLIDYLVSSDAGAERLRNQAIVYLVPVMDVDMVFVGGTGKDQLPVDFNRDWDSPSYWNAVRDVKTKMLQTAASNRMRIFIDSHDPFPGETDTTGRLFFYSMQSAGVKFQNLNKFRTMLFNAGGYYWGRKLLYPTSGQTSSKWADSVFTNIDFSASLETGWIQRTDNALWSLPLYRLNGAVLGKGISEYINQSTSINGNEMPVRFSVDVFPNPFNGKVIFRISLEKISVVKIKIYDVLGNNLAAVDFGKISANSHDFIFDASYFSSGIYFYEINAGNNYPLKKGKLVLIK